MDELGSVCGALMATLVFVENSVGGMFRPPQSEAREEGGGGSVSNRPVHVISLSQ